MEHVDLMVLLEFREKLGHKGHWDSEDLKDKEEIQEQPEILDLWAHKEQRVRQEIREPEDLQVNWDQLEDPGRQEPLDPMASKDKKVHKDRREQLVALDCREVQGLKELLEHQATEDHLE